MPGSCCLTRKASSSSLGPQKNKTLSRSGPPASPSIGERGPSRRSASRICRAMLQVPEIDRGRARDIACSAWPAFCAHARGTARPLKPFPIFKMLREKPRAGALQWPNNCILLALGRGALRANRIDQPSDFACGASMVCVRNQRASLDRLTGAETHVPPRPDAGRHHLPETERARRLR